MGKRANQMKYLRTIKGLISVFYTSQKASSKKRGHPPPAYTKQELSDWLHSQRKFYLLYIRWVRSGYKKELKPSCDRTDDYLGYDLSRMSLKTWRENLDKGHSDQKNGVNNKRSRAILQFNNDYVLVKEHYSQHQASRDTGINNRVISSCCLNKVGLGGGFIWMFKDDYEKLK